MTETPPEDTKPAETQASPPPAPEAPTAVAEPTPKDATPAEPEPKKAVPTSEPSDGHWWWGTGRRKAAVARVRIRPGEGQFVVNKRPFDSYFNEERDRKDLLNVLRKTNTYRGVDVYVNVHGGGFTGQAGAIILGLGRALLRYDSSLEPILRDNGFLTRDPRKVERKKYGQPGARRRFQFSKR